MGFARRVVGKSVRKVTPRPVRKAMSPVGTLKGAVTPKPVKKLTRGVYNVTNPVAATQNTAINAALYPGTRRRRGAQRTANTNRARPELPPPRTGAQPPTGVQPPPEQPVLGSERGCLGTLGLGLLAILALGAFAIFGPFIYAYCVAKSEQERLAGMEFRPRLFVATFAAGIGTVLLCSAMIQNAWWALFGGKPADGSAGIGRLIGALVGGLLLVGIHRVVRQQVALRTDGAETPF